MKSALLGAVLLLPALATGAAVTPPCPVPQSPRNVNPGAVPDPYTHRSDHSIVVGINTSQDEVRFRARTPPSAPIETLYRCGQHYHVPIEDPQGCAGESEVITPPRKPPAAGQWIEVHTVYASDRPPVPCLKPESLNCCKGNTILVLGFSAKVAAGGVDGPILTPAASSLAEWLGSNTGPDTEGGPTSCKPTAAAWSFRLGCGFTVSNVPLFRRLPGGPQEARPIQGGPRVSPELFLVTLPRR